eukprot:25965-Amphidinium_carterae.1
MESLSELCMFDTLVGRVLRLFIIATERALKEESPNKTSSTARQNCMEVLTCTPFNHNKLQTELNDQGSSLGPDTYVVEDS